MLRDGQWPVGHPAWDARRKRRQNWLKVLLYLRILMCSIYECEIFFCVCLFRLKRYAKEYIIITVRRKKVYLVNHLYSIFNTFIHNRGIKNTICHYLPLPTTYHYPPCPGTASEAGFEMLEASLLNLDESSTRPAEPAGWRTYLLALKIDYH